MKNLKISKKNRKVLLKGVEYSLYLLVVYFIYKKLAPNIEKVNLEDIDLTLFLLAIGIYSVHGIWNGVIWNFMVRSSGEKTVIWQQISVYLRSYLLRYIPGNVVGILSRGMLNKEYGIPVFKSIWGWFLENILYLGIGILIGLYALTAVHVDTKLIYIGIFLALMGGGVILFKHDFLENLFFKFVQPRFPKKYRGEITLMSLSIRSRFIVGAGFLLSWVIYSIAFILSVKAAGVPVGSDIFMLVAINAIAYSIGYLSLVTPSGIGVREAVMIYLLGAVLGVEPHTSVIIAVIARIVFIVGELASYLIFYLVKFIHDAINRKNI